MDRPYLNLIEHSVVFVDDVKVLRNTIWHLIKYIRHIEKEEENDTERG
jgi:hypothetical protein